MGQVVESKGGLVGLNCIKNSSKCQDETLAYNPVVMRNYWFLSTGGRLVSVQNGLERRRN